MPPLTQFKRFDLRPLLKSGTGPLLKILRRAQATIPEEGLIIVVPFLPSLRIELFGGQGFASKVECVDGGGWTVYFWHETD